LNSKKCKWEVEGYTFLFVYDFPRLHKTKGEYTNKEYVPIPLWQPNLSHQLKYLEYIVEIHVDNNIYNKCMTNYMNR
jgi:hypothetical protein